MDSEDGLSRQNGERCYFKSDVWGATRKSAKPQKDLKSRILEIAREGETRDKARASCRHDASKLRTACRDLRTAARKSAHHDDDDDDCEGTAADGRR